MSIIQVSAYLATGLVLCGCIAGLLSSKNKELREWALKKQVALKKEGITVGPRTQKLLEAMKAPEPAKEPQKARVVNKFGVPVSSARPTPKKLSRKQSKEAKV